MAWNQEAIEEIRRRVDIVEVISEYVELRRQGRNLIGLCPFHQEKTPSFSVHPEGQFFHCFGCGVGGDVFRFVQLREGLTFPEAVRRLARRAGVPEEALAPTAAARRRAALRARLVALNERALEYFRAQLHGPAGARARAYLERRGIDRETADRFGLGYAPGDGGLLQALAGQRGREGNTVQEDARRLGLILEGRWGLYERFRERLIFPIRDPSGQVVGFGGRLLGDGRGPKYLNSPESPLFHKGRVLYGLDLAGPDLKRLGKEAVVVEGYMDVIALHQAGITQAVASLGTSFTQEQAALLKRYCDRAVIAYDGDAAGDRATVRGLELLAREGVAVRVATLPPGEDPDSLARRGGPAAVQQVLEEALPLTQFLLRRALGTEPPTTVEGKAEAVSRALPILAQVENLVARAGYVEQVANKIGVSAAAVAAELERYLEQARPPTGAGRRRPGALPRAGTHDPAGARHTSRERPSKSPRFQRQAVSRWQRLEWELARRLQDDPGLLPRLERELGHPVFVGPGLASWATAFQAALEAGEPAEQVLARMPIPDPGPGVWSPAVAEVATEDLLRHMVRYRRVLELRRIERELLAADEDGIRALERLNGLLLRYHKVRAQLTPSRGGRGAGRRAVE